MSGKRLIRCWRRSRGKRAPLVLATVVETAGSTYTKPGHRILIAEDGGFQGLVSGGCLEGDLAERARNVFASGNAELVTYDLRGEDDELFGLGIGCNGMFRILLQKLDPATDYQPFATIARCMLGARRCPCAIVLESDAPTAPPGATLVLDGKKRIGWQLAEPWIETLTQNFGDAGKAHGLQPRATASGVTRTHEHSGDRIKVLYATVAPLPRLLVLGAGPDAAPLVEFADRLGWRVTVLDHREAHLARGDLRGAERKTLVEAAKLAAAVQLGRFDAAVIMSHHLATDRAYLAQLAGSKVPYIGLLGPAGRRDRLLSDLGATATQLGRRLRAPVGLSIGANTPESIALSIAADLHAATSAGTFANALARAPAADTGS
jgi:xanthine dehydrogenase accessory factor